MEPLVSIIIPVFNVEKYLSRCVKSIVEQSLKEIEIILIDDGSSDKSGEICDELSKQDDRIIVIHTKCGGVSKSRNIGLENARGQYIGFVDSDDYIDNNMFKIMYDTIEKYQCDIVEIDYQEVYGDKRESHELENISIDIIRVYNRKQAVIRTLLDNRCRKYLWDKLYRKDVFKNIHFPNGKVYEDVFITPKIIYAAKKLVKIDYVFYYYFQRKGSIVNSAFSIKFNKDHCEALDEMLKFTKESYPDLLPLVYVKFCDEWLYRIYELQKNQMEVSNFDDEINKRRLKVLEAQKYLVNKVEMMEISKNYLNNDDRSLFLRRRKVLIELYLLKHSLYLFYIFREILFGLKKAKKILNSLNK